MSEQTDVSEQATGADSGARTRGRLTLAPRVAETVSALAASQVSGVVTVESGLPGGLGSHYPKVSADIAGTKARVRIDVAVQWGTPLAQAAAAVRDRVRTQLGDMVGLDADTVDVFVVKVVPRPAPSQRRVS